MQQAWHNDKPRYEIIVRALVTITQPESKDRSTFQMIGYEDHVLPILL